MASGNPAPSTTVVFEDPPGPARYDWSKIADTLRAQPGQWGRVFENDRHSLAVSIKQSKASHPLSPHNGFEQETRNNHTENGRRMCALYLRYVPSKK